MPKKILAVLILLILSIEQTNAQENDEIISKGNPAAFSGVLVSKERYEFYQARDLEAQIYSDKLKSIGPCGPSSVSDDFSSGLGGFVLGALAGALLVSLVN